MSSGGAEDRHLLRSTDDDEAGIRGGDGDLDVESQSPAIRNSTGGVRDLFKHLDRRFSLSGRRISLKRLENVRVDREHHHHPSSSSPGVVAGEEDGVDDRDYGNDDEYGFDDGSDVLGDSAPPEWALLLIGCLIGVAAGICVAGFNKGVHVIHEWAWAGTPNEGAAWLRLQRLADTWHRILLIPVTGGVIVGMMHGLLEILDQIRHSTSSQRQGVDLLAGIFPVIKAIQAAVTLGTGCSLGPEGPSVDIGKSCANGFALMMENNRERRIALTAAGAASGIASGFNAAVAGCFFAIETVLRPLRAENSPPFTTAMIILASVISSTVSNALLGTQSAFTVPSYDLKSAAELPLYLILGMLCGAVSVVFSHLVTWFTKSFEFIKDKFGLPAIVCPALGGLGAGMIALKYPGILYWGFTNVEEILHTGKSASAPGIWLLSLPSYKLVLLLAFSLFLLVNTELGFLSPARALDNNTKVYIVYLGERENDDPELVTASHHQMLESFLDSKEDAHKSMIYSYQHGFSGFAALLTSSQANKISDHPEVIHVIPNRILKLQTTRTWDLLDLSQIPTSFSSSTTSVKGLLHDTNMGSEAIIGVIDTGIWPESKVFNDQGLGPIPKRWRGKCEPGEKFNATIHCNKKLIGAKYYVNGLLAEMGETFKTTTVREFKSNRDALGHGTHTATIAGGSLVPNVSFYGLARGTVRGGAPRARIASYKVCWNTMQKDGTGPGGSCSTADMWKAFDDAIHDGVDVLSVSISGDLPEDTEVDKPDFVGAFHAVSKGIPVVAAASNEGPKAQTVANAAPWLLTVAATTLDRSFPTKITLGNKQTLFGESLFTGPEISTGLAYWDSESGNNADVKGKIVLVFDTTSTYPVETKGVAGVIYAQHPDDIVDRCHAFPCIYTDYDLGTDILQYIRTTRSPTARISAATTLTGLPATTKVAEFSSRGPNSVSPAILKPDIAAPGVSILAALSPSDPNGHDGFGLDSGTSMVTPVVSGIIALLKSLHPDWSPAAFRSALVTTAWRTSPSGEPIFAEGSNKKLADPFDYGGGLVNPQRAADPGLVYDMGIEDYINYMCSKGYNDSSISRVLGKKTKCPTPKPSILDMNLPSITIPNIEKEVTLTRSVTNVGPIKSVYKAVIESPLGITLTVNPTTLVFSSEDKKVLSFTVKAKTSHKVNTGYFFGSLTWTDGVHDVKIPVSVQTRIMIKF